MAKTWIDAHGHFAAPGPALAARRPRNRGREARVFAAETSLDYMDRTEIAAQR